MLMYPYFFGGVIILLVSTARGALDTFKRLLVI
jgi:hypothetical protein